MLLMPNLIPSIRPTVLGVFAPPHTYPFSRELPSGGRSTGPRRLCSPSPPTAAHSW